MTEIAQIDDVLRSAIDRGDVPGVVATAATRDGVVYQGAFGRRALPDGASMSTDTVFWIASMTKAITSTAAMQLVEQGKLALDQPVSGVLPELAAPQVLEGFDPSGEPRLRPVRRPITLRHLITHTAGFVYDIWNAEIGRYMEAKGVPGIVSCQNAALALPLVFDPGDKWDYGISIDWVGKAVERVSGRSLGDYFAEHLFEPIGMKDTAFKLTDERRARLTGMHARAEDGTLGPMEFEVPQEPEFQMGGGGLYGTASDYLSFQRVFLNEGLAGGHAVLKRCRVFPRHGQEMEPRLHDFDGTGSRRTQCQESRLGGTREYLLLDRSRQRHCWRRPDATSAVCRPESSGSARRLREGGLCSPRVDPWCESRVLTRASEPPLTQSSRWLGADCAVVR
jgi:methyl acetate hydrolase